MLGKGRGTNNLQLGWTINRIGMDNLQKDVQLTQLGWRIYKMGMDRKRCEKGCGNVFCKITLSTILNSTLFSMT